MKRLHKNTVPFLVLMLIHLLLLGRAFHKEPNKKQLFAFLMSNIGFAYLFEYVVLVLRKAYVYKPKLSRRSYVDNVIGSVFSQSIFVPIAALVLVKENSGWGIRMMAAAAFAGIELLFIKWKIYKTYWWKPLYTFFLLLLYFKWSQFWYKLLRRRNPIVLFFSLYFCIWVTGMNILYMLAVTRSYKFGIGKKHSWREHFMVAPLFSVLLAFLAALQTHLFPKVGPVLMYIAAIAIDVVFLRTGIIHSRYQYPPENLLGHLMMTWVSRLYHTWIYENEQKGAALGNP